VSLPDWELWACALAIERQYGDEAPFYIAERIETLRLAGDNEGVEAWKAIADRFDKLTREPVAGPS